MAVRPTIQSISRVSAPTRILGQKLAFLVLIAAATVLLALGKTHQDAVSRLRVTAVDAIAPVLDVMSRPVDAATDVAAEVERFWHTYQENRQLRRDNLRLQQWQEVALRLQQENAALKAQLNVVADGQKSYVSARVIADSGGPFVKTLLVNAGRRDGLVPGQAAVTAAGLVGRVVEAGERASRLLLLTDLNSRVPVIVERSRYRGILAGDNSLRPMLIFLPANAKVGAGDRIVTSGHGGVFPPGLAVGVVSSVEDGEIRVQPFADWDRMEYVSVLRYHTPQLEKLQPPVLAGGPEGG